MNKLEQCFNVKIIIVSLNSSASVNLLYDSFFESENVIYLFVVLRRVQQPGSYCDGLFTGGGNQCILHCKPPDIGK